jgi:hypothetical protein
VARVIGRGLRRLRAIVWLAFLLAAPPVALVRYIGWPLPRHWPTSVEWNRYLAEPLTRASVIDLFAIAVWLMWAVLLYAVLADVTARIRRVVGGASRLRLPPLPAAMQATANGLLGAAVFSTGATVAATPPHPPVPAAAPHIPTANPPSSPFTVSADTVPTAGQPPSTTASDDQVILPGGSWLTHHTAEAVAASAVLVWWQRRRRYQPGPPTTVGRDDPDLAALPATVTTIQAQLHPALDQPPDTTTSGQSAGSHSSAATGQAAPSRAAPGELGTRLLLPTDLPTRGVGLTGPAALDAARGMLIAALLAAGDDDEPRVVTTAADLPAVLGEAAGWPDEVPGLVVAEHLAEAVVLAESVAMRRAAHRVPSPTNPIRPHGVPTLMLITSAPQDPGTAHRVAALLTLAAAHHVTGVLLGYWPHGDTWTVEAGGTVHPGNNGVRISVLDQAATLDLLTVYREAHPRLPTPPQTAQTPSSPVSAHAVSPLATPGRPDGAPVPMAAATSTSSRLWLRVLGEPAVYAHGSPTPVRLPRSATLAILVFLALHPDGATTTDLTTALWPQLHANTTANRIYTTISATRKVLDPIATGPTIVRAGDRYRLNPDHVDVDLWHLHTAIDQAATTTNPTARTNALRQVVNSYTGDLAAGWAWPWVDPHREAIHRHVVDARAALSAEHVGPGPTGGVQLSTTGTRPVTF